MRRSYRHRDFFRHPNRFATASRLHKFYQCVSRTVMCAGKWLHLKVGSARTQGVDKAILYDRDSATIITIVYLLRWLAIFVTGEIVQVE